MFALAAHPLAGKLRLFALTFVFTAVIPAWVTGPIKCSGTLPAGDHRSEDVIVNGDCIVDGAGGTPTNPALYVYHNINIVAASSLTFLDKPIDFHVESVVIENTGKLIAGNTTAPIGTNGGRLRIFLWGKSTDPGIECQTDARCGVPEALWKSNPSLAMRMTGRTSCNEASKYGGKLPGDDCFYQYDIIDNQDKTANKNAYFAHKVIALSFGGTLHLYGKKGAIYDAATDNNPANTGISWARLSNISGNTLTLDLRQGQSLNWEADDRIVVTSTDYLPTHSEVAEIQSVSGNTITLKEALEYPHNTNLYSLSTNPYSLSDVPADKGPRADPNLTTGRAVETRAAVALLTRSIIITSEGDEPDISPDGDHFPPTPKNYYGGHTIVRQGFASYQVQGVEFWRLGQGGIIGRYPVHFHMARKTPQPSDANQPAVTFLKDCTIDDSMTRWITVHATQGVTLQRNVGYRSIGHGFYLEDATETFNKLYANIGISVIAGVYSPDLNPRQVPGILAAPDTQPQPDSDYFPYRSDWNHPAAFWIMNGWNDFRYNAAVGVTSCGACYWLVPGAVSGPSTFESWRGYASQGIDNANAGSNRGRAGLSPLQTFIGNSCSAAMTSFQTVSETFDCHGVTRNFEASDSALVEVKNPIAPSPSNLTGRTYYPTVTSLRNPTVCEGADNPNSKVDCSKAPPCAATGENKNLCMATVLDHYTTSFNYAQTNFAAIWLRPWWYLVTDSAITDSQYGGLNFVTAGGYTRSDAPAGFWSVVYRSVFIGTSQAGDDEFGTPANAYASNAGPFNPTTGLECASSSLSSCVSVKDGVAMQLNDFPGQRMFSIYDGPAFQQDNAYLDVYPTFLKNCTPSGEKGGTCAGSGWMYGRVTGVPKTKIEQFAGTPCYLPNAAIGWKQPNGFYYPPAFHSLDLYFRNTNIRHFVIEPKFLPGTFLTDMPTSSQFYCNFKDGFFTGFTDIDRQTVLNDGLPTLYENGTATGQGDGSLTGLTANNTNQPATTDGETISVNEDPFFNAPKETVECASDLHASDQDGKGAPGTAKTSPYEYPTIGMIADCAIGGVPPNQCVVDGKAYWGDDCGSAACFGPQLYRQYLTSAEWNQQVTKRSPSIHMMGQGNGQRSTLSINHGHYYLDTTPNCKFQTGGADCPPAGGKTPSVSVFLPGHSYHMYLVYGRQDTTQTYDIYIGKTPTSDWSVTPERSIFNDNNFQFRDAGASNWLTIDDTHIADLGVVRVTVDLTKSSLAADFTKEFSQFCKPTTYCEVKGPGECGCAKGTNCKDDAVCSWGPADPDCPETGCYGFAIKMPGNFQTLDKPLFPPPPQLFTSDPYFANGKVTFGLADSEKAGQQCTYTSPPGQ
jgi:hypothetical protein